MTATSAHLALAEAWLAGEQTADRAAALLAPHRHEGFMVCTDTAGYSRMGRLLDPAQMLQAVAGPKGTLHGLGTGLGGRAVGEWVSDNTEMLYPSSVSPDELLRAMLSAHVHDAGFGIALHRGVVYDVGDCTYGPDADTVYNLAELHCSGGQTVVTEAFYEALQDPGSFHFTPHAGGLQVGGGEPYDGPRGSDRWPDPFPPGLMTAESGERWRCQRVVGLIKRSDKTAPVGLVGTMNQIAGDAMLERATLQVIGAEHSCVRGAISLFALESAAAALEALQAIRTQSGGLELCGALAQGEILEFEGPEYAGDAVNTASKLAEDVGSPGESYVTLEVAKTLGLAGLEARLFRVSGVVVEARLL